MLPFALLLAVTLALTVAGKRRRDAVVDESRAAMLDALAGLPRAPSAGQVPRRREAAGRSYQVNTPARPALYDQDRAGVGE